MTVMTADLWRGFAAYADQVFAPEDDVLRALAARTRELGVAEMQVSAAVGKLLHVLALAVGARRILEVGTLLGYSAIWMARALPPGGKLVTLEADPARTAEAEDWIRRAGLHAAIGVEVRAGPALETLPRLGTAGAFDFAFIDAAKEEYPAYLDWALQLVRRGGVIAADNTLFSGSREGTVLDEGSSVPAIRAVREFNRRVATDPRLASIVLPIREGVSVSLVR